MDKRKNIENIYPLSPMQQGILFHTLLAPESGVYVPQIVLTLTGELDAATLHQAWQQAVTHYDVLRTGFYWEQRDDPFQVVYRQVELPWVHQDWRSQSPELQATRLQVFLDCNQTQPFDLHTPPLMRLALMQVGDRTHHLIWAYHHLILDGWSAANLLKTVFSQYFAITRSLESTLSFAPNSPSPYLPIPPTTPYAHDLTWLQTQDATAAQTFWQSYLQGFSAPTPLPIGTTLAAPNVTLFAPTEQQCLLSTEQTAQLRAFGQRHQLTLNTLIQGALGLLLSRYCDRDDVVFGATGAGRPPAIPGAAAMVGLFINTLPVRVQVPETAEVIPWLQQLQRDRASASTYEYSALVDVQTWSELPPGQALFDCLLVMENYPVNAALLAGQSDLALADVRFIEWTHLPLTLLVSTGEHLSLTAKYRSDRFPQDAIHRLLTHLEGLLMGLTTHKWLRDIPLLTPAEQAQIHLWNQTATDYPSDCPLPALIDAQVERTPEAIAVRFEDETLTYRDLNARADQLAHHLQSLGVGPEVPVAVCVDRSLDLAVALFGILKAGGAYLPLDPSYPRDRLTWMLQDAAPPVIITHSPTQDLTATLTDLLTSSHHYINLSEPLTHFTTPVRLSSRRSPLPHSTTSLLPQHPISLLYTSGSTGRPKGVINTHRGLVNRLCWMQDAYPLTTVDCVLQKTPLSFDVSAWEMFWPLMTGACLVLARPAGHKDSAYLVELIQREQITTLHFVPAMLTAFLEAPNVANCTSLKRVICSGETLPSSLQTQFFQTLPSVELHNLYGPTEAAIDVTAWPCQPKSPPSTTVPIGRPIANTQIYLLDSQQRLVPPGIPGELYIGGLGVARGYWHRPDLTAERFVPNPFEAGIGNRRQGIGDREQEEFRTLYPDPITNSPEPITNNQQPITNNPEQSQNPSTQLLNHPSTLYKTGDRARYRPDGTLEYLGRIDHQVKLRGFRIELGEIEAVLTQHPDVSQAVVVLREDNTSDPQLIAYVVDNGASITNNQERITHNQKLPTPSLRTYLTDHLPPYMVPSQFVTLAALPLLPNGKVNRKALPTPDLPERVAARSPQTATEGRIADIWQTVLQLEAVSVADNFFELGGNSLSATRVNTRLRKTFELDIPLRVMFEHPTVADLAVHIDALQMTLNSPVAAAGRKEIEL